MDLKALTRLINGANHLSADFKNHVIKYIQDVKSGIISNDFVDFETLNSVILHFTNNNIKIEEGQDQLQLFNQYKNAVRAFLPQGNKKRRKGSACFRKRLCRSPPGQSPFRALRRVRAFRRA